MAVKRFAALYGNDLSQAYQAHDRLKKLKDVKQANVREAVEAFPAMAPDTGRCRGKLTRKQRYAPILIG